MAGKAEAHESDESNRRGIQASKVGDVGSRRVVEEGTWEQRGGVESAPSLTSELQ